MEKKWGDTPSATLSIHLIYFAIRNEMPSVSSYPHGRNPVDRYFHYVISVVI